VPGGLYDQSKIKKGGIEFDSALFVGVLQELVLIKELFVYKFSVMENFIVIQKQGFLFY